MNPNPNNVISFREVMMQVAKGPLHGSEARRKASTAERTQDRPVNTSSSPAKQSKEMKQQVKGPKDKERDNSLAEIEKRVLEAFEKAKPRMCKEAVEETQQFLNSREWLKDCKNPSNHPCYSRIKGSQGSIDYPDNCYYPYFLVMQAIWPDNPTVARIAQSFAKYWMHLEIEDGPEHYPVLKNKKLELRLFRGKVDMSWSEWNKCDAWYEIVAPRLSEDEEEEEANEGDAGNDGTRTTKGTGKNAQNIDNLSLDQMESAAESRVKRIRTELNDAKKDLRKVQEKQRDKLKTVVEYWKMSAEGSKKKAADDTKRAKENMARAERFTREMEIYNKKLGDSITSSRDTSLLSGERKSGDAHPAKRKRQGG
ncbi:hypothetical protein F53441_6295 [Fusarium austroafricanum]|uniref:Uncharacterized protein n=1 Tax=Fusarium austroafricanum TaxID=2364996 RepID=A0A8H4KJ45_9HYPO|nr:hypothetical protein F53441_6295 [Fusarium austroafricanum]